jgi:tight adherence protein B
MSNNAIIILVILMVLIAAGMVATIFLLNLNEKKKRALQIISGKSGIEKNDNPSGNPNKRRANMSKRLQKDEDDTSVKKISPLVSMLRQSGWGHITVTRYWLTSLGIGLVLMLITKISGQSNPIVIMSGIIGVFGLPKMVLSFKTSRRQKKFLEEFPDALESMVRLLKAGMPVGEAIAMVSREFTGPVGEEMSKVYDEQKIGISMAEACLHAAERMPITEMQMFATGIAIQQQTGSSLSEILINLAKVIRARFRLKRKVQALSAEAKASAMIIGALPIVVGLGMTIINPDYMFPLYNTLKGKYMLYGAIGWMACGVLIMKQMINFRV